MNGEEGLQDKIMDFFPGIIYIYDLIHKRLTYINRKITELLGYSYNDVLGWGSDLMKIVYKDDVELVTKEWQKFYTLEDGECLTYNARLNHNAGTCRHFRTTGTVLDREKGHVSSVLFVAQDITEEVETGSKFKRIEEQFNDTQEVLKFGVWEWNVRSNKITWSNGLYKMLGYDPPREKEPQEVTPEFYLQHIVEADHKNVLYTRPNYLLQSEYDLYFKVRDTKGHIKDVREKARVIRNDQNEPLSVIGSTIDVTEQLQLYRDLAAYKAMKQENERFLDYGTWEFDARTRVFFWSDGMYRLFGYDPEADKNLVINEALYRRHLGEEQFGQNMLVTGAMTAQEDQPINDSPVYEYQITLNDGSIKRLESSVKLIYDVDGNWIKTVGTSRDITRLRQYQTSLEEKVRDLDRSNKELEEFAYVASHDMNEPLRKITTFIERLENKYRNELGADGQLYLTRISASVENMRLLIDTLLEFSRTARSNQPFVKVDLNMLLGEVRADLELKIEETTAQIRADGLPVIDAIPSQMKQLFDNLVSNSIKFRKQGTQPVINIRGQRLSHKQKEQYNLDAARNWFKIDCSDNGIGFEPEYRERIFQIFQRLHGKTEYPGSGIGLAICKKIIDQHKGIIYATGKPDHGATFTIILPESQ
jgi:PAS domain S-box-containing protein